MAEPQTVPDGKVAVISPTGKLGYIPPDQVEAAHGEGYRILSTEDANARLFAKEKGVTGAVRAFGESAASAATLGLSDVAGGALGGDEWRAQRKMGEEAYSTASGLGTAAGVVAPALLSGGSSIAARGAVGASEAAAKAGAIGLAESGAASGAAARGALALGRAVTAPARGALALGRGAEALVAGGEVAGRTVKGLLPTLGVTGESLAGRALTSGAKMAASGAVEGAAFGAGEALSEAALAPGGDYSHLAEKILAGGEQGALFGAALGGGLGAVGGVASKVVSKMAERIGEVKLDKLAADNAIKSVAADGRAASELLGTAEGRAMGLRMLEDDIVKGGKSYEEMLAKSRAVKATAAEAESNALSVLDDAGMALESRSLIGKIQKDIIAPLAKKDARAAELLSKHISDIADETGQVGFARLHAFGNDLAPESVWGGARVPETLRAAVTKARRVIDGTIDDGVRSGFAKLDREQLKAIGLKRAIATEGDAAAAAQHADSFVASMADGGAAKAFEDAKLSGRAARFAEENLLKRASSGDDVEKALELTDNVRGAAGFAAGLVSHGAGFGMLTGGAISAASSYARKHGRSIIADLAYRASKADTALLGKVKAFVRGTGDTRRAAIGEAAAVDVDHALNKAPSETRGEAFERMAASVRAGPAAQPMVVDAEAPQTGAAMRGVIQKGMAFLATKLPPQQQNPSPFYQTPPASAESVAKFARYVKAVKDPLSVVDSMNAGTVSSEEIEALEAVYPSLYEQIKENITTEITNRKGPPLPQAKSVQVGVLFGIPTIPTLEPGNYQLIQATYTVEMKPPQQQGAPSNAGSPSQISKSFATEAERLEGQELQI